MLLKIIQNAMKEIWELCKKIDKAGKGILSVKIMHELEKKKRKKKIASV